MSRALIFTIFSLVILSLSSNSEAASSHDGGGSSPNSIMGTKGTNEFCNLPESSTGLAVDTDGGAANGSATHNSNISYQNQYGFKPDPNKFLGAVAIDPNLKLTAFDIICYENTSNQKQVCGFVFDNGYTSGQMKSGTKPDKPAEATALIHKQLGAEYATGKGSSLSNVGIKSLPIKLPENLKDQVKSALAVAKETGNYHQVNQLAQELGGNAPCAGNRINPKYDGNIY